MINIVGKIRHLFERIIDLFSTAYFQIALSVSTYGIVFTCIKDAEDQLSISACKFSSNYISHPVARSGLMNVGFSKS